MAILDSFRALFDSAGARRHLDLSDLTAVRGVGRITARRLTEAGYGTFLEIRAATEEELLEVPGIGPATASLLKDWAEKTGLPEEAHDLGEHGVGVPFERPLASLADSFGSHASTALVTVFVLGMIVLYAWGPGWITAFHALILFVLLPVLLVVGLIAPDKVPFGQSRTKVVKRYGSAFLAFVFLTAFLPGDSELERATGAYESGEYAAAADLLYTIHQTHEDYESAQQLLVSVEGRLDSLVEEAQEAAEEERWERASALLQGIPASYPHSSVVQMLRQRAKHHRLLDVGRRALEADAFVAAWNALTQIPDTAETYAAARSLVPEAQVGLRGIVREAEQVAATGDYSGALDMVEGIPPRYLNMRRVDRWRAAVQAIRDSLRTIRSVQGLYAHVGTRVRARPTTSSAIVEVLPPDTRVWAGEAREDGWIPVYDERQATPKGFVRGDLLHSSRRPTRRARRAPYVLRTGYGGVPINSHRDYWDDAHTIATVPEGTPARLLSRVDVGFGLQRCRVRANAGRTITGWVMCGDLSRR